MEFISFSCLDVSKNIDFKINLSQSPGTPGQKLFLLPRPAPASIFVPRPAPAKFFLPRPAPAEFFLPRPAPPQIFVSRPALLFFFC